MSQAGYRPGHIRTFSTQKHVKSTGKTEIEWQTKHWTIVSDLLPLTLRHMQACGNTSLSLRFSSDFLVSTKCKVVFAVASFRTSSGQFF